MGLCAEASHLRHHGRRYGAAPRGLPGTLYRSHPHTPFQVGGYQRTAPAVALLRQEYPAAPILSIVEYPDSELAKQSDLSIHIPWANEISRCAKPDLFQTCMDDLMAVAPSAMMGRGEGAEKPRPADTSDFEIFSLFLAKAVR